MIKKISLIVILGITSYNGFAQSEDKLGSWYIYNGFLKFSPKFEIFFDTQYRTYEVVSNSETFLVRPYFTYNINENLQPGLGLEYLKGWTYDELPENKTALGEFRITTQFIISQKVSRVRLQHRYRYEFRFVEGDPFQRMRYRLQVTVPITSENLTKGNFFANAYIESFITTKPNLVFSQNWLFLAGGYQFTNNLNLQVGYLAVSRPGTVHSRLQFFVTQKLWFFNKN